MAKYSITATMVGLALMSAPSIAVPSYDVMANCANKNTQLNTCKPDVAALQNAIDTGYLLQFSSGTYIIADAQFTSNGNITIYGLNRDNVTIQTDRFYLSGNASATTINVSGITFQSITSNDKPYGSSSLLSMSSAKNLNFTSNRIVNTPEEGLSVHNINQFHINSNEFNGTGVGGFTKTIDGETVPSGTALAIGDHYQAPVAIANTINGNIMSNITGMGIWIKQSNITKLTIDGAIITNKNYGTGIYLEGNNSGVLSDTSGVTISNGKFLNYTINGLRLNGSDITAYNNDLCGPAPRAIKTHYLKDSSIKANKINLDTNNCITNSGQNGIELLPSSSFGVSNVTISENKIHDISTGVVIYNDGGTFADITVGPFNEIRNFGWAGVRADGIKDNQQTYTGIDIRNNTISNGNVKLNISAAVDLRYISGANVYSNWIYSNASKDYHGNVYILDSDNVTLDANSIWSGDCASATRGGVVLDSVDSTSDNIQLKTNTINRMAQPGYRLYNGATAPSTVGFTFQHTC